MSGGSLVRRASSEFAYIICSLLQAETGTGFQQFKCEVLSLYLSNEEE
jgi:hypothetical protein